MLAVQAGADLVNDVWGLKYDPEMAGVIAKHDAAMLPDAQQGKHRIQ